MVMRLNRRRLLGGTTALASAGIAFPFAARAQDATPVAPVSAEWPLYGHDLSGAKFAAAGGIDVDKVGTLGPLWTVETQGPVSATPVIADGVAYVGSYDGNLYAIALQTGAVRWTYASGADVQEPNLQIPLGIPGSAAVGGDTVYVGDASAVVHAVDAATGQARWTKQVDTQQNASIWSSPVVTADRVYVGVASVAKETGFRGSVVALDRNSGKIVWQTFMVPDGADGAGVFAVPAIDEARNRLYVGTQNAYSANPAPYGNPISIVALDLDTGDIDWAFEAMGDSDTAPTDDVGFSASPNLFTATVGGAERDLVGEGQKSGDYWALDRDTGDVVWQAKVSPAGFLGGMEGTSAVAAGVIAVPATDWPEFEGPASGLVSGLDAATGDVLWTVTEAAPAASPAAISVDVVFHAGIDGVLHAFALADGSELWNVDLGSSVSGGIAVADGVVVLGAATPQFGPFVLPGNTIRAFALGASGATPVAPAAATPAG